MFEFPEILKNEWNSIFRNFRKRGQPREVHPNFGIFIAGISVPIDFSTEISGIFGLEVGFLEINSTIFALSGNPPSKSL